MKTFLVIAMTSGSIATPLIGGHANPWATEDDVLQMQYHEENLARSVGTPGEDELLGAMVQKASGKLDDRVGADASGGAGGDNGGKGK